MKTETPTPTPSQRVDQVCWGINRDSGLAKLAYQLAAELEQAQGEIERLKEVVVGLELDTLMLQEEKTIPSEKPSIR